MSGAKQKHLTFVGCFGGLAEVEVVHELLLVGVVFFGERFGGFAVVIVLKEHREEVFDRFALAVPHRVHCSEDSFGNQLVAEPATSAVASDDAIDLPECNLVEELMARDSYLTNEQLVDVPRRG